MSRVWWGSVEGFKVGPNELIRFELEFKFQDTAGSKIACITIRVTMK